MVDNIKVFIFTFTDNLQYIVDELEKNDIIVTEEIVESNFILAIGGDGTILASKTLSMHYGKPVVGFNAGTLGFLSCGNNLEILISILKSGNYVTQSRKLLRISLNDVMPIMPNSWALNDIVIENNDRSRLAVIDVAVVNTDEHISFHCDKLIFSTPTGSTAYNLSAGGSILHPDVNGLAITPVAPFSMSARSIVVPDDFKLIISSQEDLFIKIDGRGDYRITKNKPLNINYDGNIDLVKSDNKFFDVITSKLNWNTQIKK